MNNTEKAEQQLESHRIEWQSDKSSVIHATCSLKKWEAKEIMMTTQIKNLWTYIHKVKNKEKLF